jgi:hypothetical protein
MNAHEAAARQKKITALVQVIDRLARESGVPADAIPAWLRRLPESGATDSSWATLALLAGVRRPSEKTRTAVIELYEATADVDPFARCG